MVNRYRKIVAKTLALAGFALIVSSPSNLQGGEFACQIIGVDKNAWILRGDTGVKITPVKPGDVLYYGDTLTVVRGNSVDVSFDAQKGNVFHIEGQTDIKITKGLAKQLEMKEGRIFAFLDNPTADRNFKVVTPTAVAAVRGTRFSVQSSSAGPTHIATYEGSVQVRARDAEGKERKDYIVLRADNKTVIEATESPVPLETLPLSTNDTRQYRSAISTIEKTVAQSGVTKPDTATDGLVERVIVEEDPARTKYLL
ncbi:MAG: hypothetical protein MOGMAGMI_01127 [Candidatus Omnitrophica bacterium]|nr:hypothetical protein [Candidatus Omnitrophota bacterium]